MDIPEWIFQNEESYIKSTTWKYRPRRTKVDGLALNVSCRGSAQKMLTRRYPHIAANPEMLTWMVKFTDF